MNADKKRFISPHRKAAGRFEILAFCVLLTAWSTGPLLAGTDSFGVDFAKGDFDGDGFEDLAVGAPARQSGGTVEVYYGNVNGLSTTSQSWHQDVSGVPGVVEANDNFGYSVASGDFNDDGYDDLAVGVPGEDIGAVVSAGAVNVIYGNSSGLVGTGSWIWYQGLAGIAAGSEAGDEFGFDVAAGDFDGDGFDDLAIGVPGEDIGAITDTGMVNIVYGSSSGLSSLGNDLWYQGKPGMQEQDEVDDAFGTSLAVGDFDRDGFDDLAIGVPGESFESKGADGKEAGRISIMFGSAVGLDTPRNEVFHLDRGSILGTASTYDRFGWSVAAGDFNGEGTDDLAIGAPEEDFGAPNAGTVTILYFFSNAPGAYAPQTLRQGGFNSGVPESGDLFGFSLTTGNFDGDSRDDLAIGMPGENVGSIVACGGAHVFYGSNSGLLGSGSVPTEIWHQDSPGIADACEFADLAGIGIGSGDFNGDGSSELVLGVPLDQNSASIAHVIPGSSSGLTSTGSLVLP